MQRSRKQISRRSFVAGTLMASAASCHAVPAEQHEQKYKICAFIKFIQSLSNRDLAQTMAELGFDGIEATVRRGGYILPERVEEDLPKLVEALQKNNLEINVMASDINRVDQSMTLRVLKTASALGVKRYRMGNYHYDHRRSVWEQLNEIRPALKDLVALNRELGISALYQNHSGARYVGAVLWDLHQLIKDYPVGEVGVAFDIRHATVEGGLSWPTHFNLMRPHMGAVYVKDFIWEGRRPTNVRLGEGQVDPAFFKLLKSSDFHGPVSLHVEYLPEAGTLENVEALAADLKTLRQLLAA